MRCTRVCRNVAYDFLIILVLGMKQYSNREKNTNYILRFRYIYIIRVKYWPLAVLF